MKVIILAGGGGTRLFPLSRTNFPKQFLKTFGDRSLLIHTVQRFINVVDEKDIVIVTGDVYKQQVLGELKEHGLHNVNVLLEPVARNTAPAILLAAKYCQQSLASSSDEVLFISTSDHLITPQEEFEKCLLKAEKAACKGDIVTFGIMPTAPDTGYGYIQTNNFQEGVYKVQSFKEKPDAKTAEDYLACGGYYWNSGMFAFKINTFYEELKHNKELFSSSDLNFDVLLDRFEQMPNISIDYAVAEKSSQVVMMPLNCYWNDIGSWDAMYDCLDKDLSGNVLQGDCVQVDCTDSLLMSKNRLIAGIGLKEVLVVETDDVILVTQKGESQKVKDVVQQLKQAKRSEVDNSTTTYRPWGHYTVLSEAKGYKIKKIVVNVGEKLSLQMHYHRSEHWVVTSGTALVTNNGKSQLLEINQSTFIPIGVKHRLENPGKIPLEIIEIQSGKYLQEDDIVRFDDIYDRE